MELVYLWVEEYKNIKNQGFNFSPRFTCKYDEANKELTIDENKDCLENFFGENINVTAIVGENGSGKTSILEEIMTTLPSGVIVYLMNDKFEILGSEHILEIIYNNTDNAHNKLETNISRNMQHITSDMMRLDKVGDWSSYYSTRSQFSNVHWSMSNDGISKIDLTKYERSIKALIIKNYDIFDSTFFDFKPINIQIYSTKKDVDNSLSLINKIESFIGTGLTTNIIELQLTKEELNTFANFIGEGTIEVSIKDNKNIEIFDLSQGERKSFVDSLILFDFINSNENCLILLDEPDLTIHPKWQKRYINDLINSFQNFHKKIHFVITSHSQFLLSDLPKENIVFLENAKQVNPFENKQTFGANIHTLLSHGFFMKDGLMGEFAKGKINDVHDFLTNLNTQSELTQSKAQSIINLIGEPILKKELQNLYDEKFETSDIDKQIRGHQEEIAKLEAKRKKDD